MTPRADRLVWRRESYLRLWHHELKVCVIAGPCQSPGILFPTSFTHSSDHWHNPGVSLSPFLSQPGLPGFRLRRVLEMPTCRAPPLSSNHQTSVDPPCLFPPRPMASTTCSCLFSIPCGPFIHSYVAGPPIYAPLSLTILIPPGTTLKGGLAALRSLNEVGS